MLLMLACGGGSGNSDGRWRRRVTSLYDVPHLRVPSIPVALLRLPSSWSPGSRPMISHRRYGEWYIALQVGFARLEVLSELLVVTGLYMAISGSIYFMAYFVHVRSPWRPY